MPSEMLTILPSTVMAKLRFEEEYFTLGVRAQSGGHFAMLPRSARISGRISSSREKALKDAMMPSKLVLSVLSKS